ncbi:MAG: phage integrase N-terminal SAM-like domain-containing protein [Kangiellaceae bacterium]|nr:phage integrase N-terminal SAM-like domain-containing protein [Kangiellaceae bacterium]MCW9000859.1 phage integrase N-terminal SAM-like domain-containing protein [Kangiellaceae bacterium]
MVRSEFMWQVRSTIRARQYSFRTEKTYVFWIKQFLHSFSLKHPKEMGDKEVNIFLTHLAC